MPPVARRPRWPSGRTGSSPLSGLSRRDTARRRGPISTSMPRASRCRRPLLSQRSKGPNSSEMKRKNCRWRPQLVVCVVACLFTSSLVAQTPVGSEFLVNPESLGAQNQPDLRFDDQGRLWIAWVDSIGLDADFNRVIVRVISEQGTLGPELVLVDTSDTPHTPVFHPLIVPKRGEDLRLFYLRSNEDGYDLVYGQRFNSTGELNGQRFLVTPEPPGSTQRFDAA